MGPTGTGVDLCASAQERLQGVSHSSPQIISSSSAFLSRSTAVSVDEEGAREVFCLSCRKSKTRGRRKDTVVVFFLIKWGSISGFMTDQCCCFYSFNKHILLRSLPPFLQHVRNNNSTGNPAEVSRLCAIIILIINEQLSFVQWIFTLIFKSSSLHTHWKQFLGSVVLQFEKYWLFMSCYILSVLYFEFCCWV